jgi:hypothetical protein
MVRAVALLVDLQRAPVHRLRLARPVRGAQQSGEVVKVRYQLAVTELDNAAYGLCKVRLSSMAGFVAPYEYVTGREEWELPDDFHIVFVASLPDMLKGLRRQP